MKTPPVTYDVLPLLGRGKHRNPRKGACFMELASYLAGERWSDSPACTHKTLAHLARLINDLTSDGARPRLAPLIPSVIGLRSADPRWDYELALLAAARALPIAAETHQRPLAVGVLVCERAAARLHGLAPDELTDRSRAALDAVPLAAAWARDFLGRSAGRGHRCPAPVVIECATAGIATACVPDPDDRLRLLLVAAIETCRALAGRTETPAADLAPADWAGVCAAASR